MSNSNMLIFVSTYLLPIVKGKRALKTKGECARDTHLAQKTGRTVEN